MVFPELPTPLWLSGQSITSLLQTLKMEEGVYRIPTVQAEVLDQLLDRSVLLIRVLTNLSDSCPISLGKVQ